jgi:beta-phosphoglucomutase
MSIQQQTKQFKAALFDLDGVIVDTARYHFLAWGAIAKELGIPFDEHTNERLKGVSRMASLDIILEQGKRPFSDAEKLALAEKKNNNYVDMIGTLKPEEILPGVKAFLTDLRAAGIKTSICSASKNAVMILERLELVSFFDTIVSGNDTTRSKPDPQVFQIAADRFGFTGNECLVFEDAFAGIEGAKAAGMMAVGIGQPNVLHNADLVYTGTALLSLSDIRQKLYA